jgi:hypothetical protein
VEMAVLQQSDGAGGDMRTLVLFARVESTFVSSGCYSKLPWAEQNFISHSSGGWKSKVRVPACRFW